MNKFEYRKGFFILGLVILMIGCAAKPGSVKTIPNTIPEPTTQALKSTPIVEDGWGFNPKGSPASSDANSMTDNDWYTKKYSGKANDRSIELKSPSYMEFTCGQAVKKENGKALIESAYTSVATDIKSDIIAQINAKITGEELKKIEVTNCKSTSSEKPFSECECNLSFKVEGGKKTILNKISSLNK